MHRRLTCVGLLLAVIAAVGVAAAPLPRLAILTEDAATETATCVDLLTAALGQGGEVELVERAELRRIRDEQKLTTAGLVSPDQTLALGKLLRADGILFVAGDAAGKTLTARLAETRQGLVAGLWRYRLDPDPIEKTVSLIAADVRAGLGKLATTGEKSLLVSVLRVGNATLDPEFLWIEDELPLLLGSLLTRDSRVLLLERRKLTQLLEETKTSAGGAAAFRAAGILLDADIALQPNVAIAPDRLKRAVVMTVRLRTPQLLELASVSVAGTAGQTDQLTAEAATQLLARLRELKSLPVAGDAKAEANLFRDIGARQWTATAADAAHALAPTDTAALEDLVKALLRPVPPKAAGERAARDAVVEWARNLGRAADLVRSRPDLPGGDTFVFGVLKDCPLMRNHSYALNKNTRQDPEIRALLRPVGQVARLVLESRRARWPDRIESWELVMTQYTFVDSDLECLAYMEPLLLARLDAKGDRSTKWRKAATGMLSSVTGWYSWQPVPTWSRWKGFMEKAATRPEPEVSYGAHVGLALLENNPQHVWDIARLLPALCDGPDDWLDSWERAQAICWPLDNVARLWQTESVEWIGPVLQQVLDKELAAGRLKMLQLAVEQFMVTLPYRPALLSPPTAVALLEKGLALAPKKQAELAAAPVTPWSKGTADNLKSFVERATKLQESLRAQLAKVAPSSPAPARAGVEVLWRSGSPEWIAAFREARTRVYRVGNWPPFCLVDGDTIWGAFSARQASAPGLFQVDAGTGRLLSVRLWELTEKQLTAVGETINKSALSLDRGHADMCDDDEVGGPWIMCRWRDSVCLTMWGLGVCLVPADSAGKGEVRAIGRRQGLPALDLIGIAPAGDTLYIASRLALVRARAGHDQVELVANLAGDTTTSSVPRGMAIRALVTDRAGKNVYLLLREPWKEPPAGYQGPARNKSNRRCSVWGLEIGTGQWRLVRGDLVLHLGARNVPNPLGDPAKPGPVPRLPVVPGTAEEAADYLVRWADELQGLRMATLADGSVIVAARNYQDSEFYFYRVPASPPPVPAAK